MRSKIGQLDVFQFLRQWGKPLLPEFIADQLRVDTGDLIALCEEMVANDILKWYGDKIGLVNPPMAWRYRLRDWWEGVWNGEK